MRKVSAFQFWFLLDDWIVVVIPVESFELVVTDSAGCNGSSRVKEVDSEMAVEAGEFSLTVGFCGLVEDVRSID